MKHTCIYLALLLATAASAAPPEGTTLQKTVVKSTFHQGGSTYSQLSDGPGEPFVVQSLFPLSPSIYYTTSFTPVVTNPLISFAQLSDFQIVDDASTARVPFTDRLAPGWDTGSAYRPQEMLSTHMADAMARSIRKVGSGPATKLPLKFALVTGDNVDNMQYNETRWYIDTLDGAVVKLRKNGATDESPSAGHDWNQYWIPDNPTAGGYPGFPKYYQTGSESFWDIVRKPYQASGLGIPWYTVFGNHDVMVQGNLPLNPESPVGDLPTGSGLNAYAVGNTRIQDLFGLPPKQDDATWYGTTWDLINHDIWWSNYPATPNADRRLLGRAGYIAEHFNTTGAPAGHGFAPGSSLGYYAIPSGPNDLFQFIALDTNSSRKFGAQGAIDGDQIVWLEDQLRAVSSRYRPAQLGGAPVSDQFVLQPWVKDKLVVLYGHHKIGSLIKDGIDSEEFRKMLLRFPNVIMYVNGHSHANNILPHSVEFSSSNRNGFWEINTSSASDWPVQSRLIEVGVGADPKLLSIYTTMVDIDAPLNPGTSMDSIGVGTAQQTEQLASLGRQLSANDPGELSALDRRRGIDPGVRNAQLVLPAPFVITGGGAPTARFVNTINHATRTAAFSSASSSDSDGTIVSRMWDFGDGTTSQVANPSKTYAKFGTYSVKLTVVDNLGYSGTLTQSVEFRDPCGCAELQNNSTVTAYRRAINNRFTQSVVPARFSFYVPPGATNLKVNISNSQLGNDGDIYARAGEFPTATSYQCRSILPGTNESCSVTNPVSGYWYIEAVPAGVSPGYVAPALGEGEIPSDQLQSLKVDIKASYSP